MWKVRSLAVLQSSRDFSSRYVSMLALCAMWVAPSSLKTMRMYLPKREELWLRCVFALPSDSRIGLDCTIRSLRPAAVAAFFPCGAARQHRYRLRRAGCNG